MRRSKSAARARCRCGERCAPTSRAARGSRSGGHRAGGRGVLAGCSRRRRAARRAADVDHAAAGCRVAGILRRAHRRRPRARHRTRRRRSSGSRPSVSICATKRFRRVRGWMESLGPVTVAALAETLAFPADVIEQALLQLESRRPGDARTFPRRRYLRTIEWCNRRILARIHRLTLGPAAARDRAGHRRAIPAIPVIAGSTCCPEAGCTGSTARCRSSSSFRATRFRRPRGSPTCCRSASRTYEPEFLDQLCLAGEVMWARLSPHPAFEVAEPRRVRPTRTAPIAIFLRESADWLAAHRDVKRRPCSRTRRAKF